MQELKGNATNACWLFFPTIPTTTYCFFLWLHKVTLWVCNQQHVCVSRWMIIWRDEAMQFHCDVKPLQLHDLLDKTSPTQHGRCTPFGRQGREMYLGNIPQVWKGLRHSFVSSFYSLLQSQALWWVWLWERIRSAFRFVTRKRNQQQPVVTEHCN